VVSDSISAHDFVTVPCPACGEPLVIGHNCIAVTRESLFDAHNFASETCACDTTEDGWRPCPPSLCERPDHHHEGVCSECRADAVTPKSDAQKLAAAIGSTRELGRFQDGDERTPIVVYSSHADTGYRILISQEDDPDQILVLTPNELRWLVHVMFGDPDTIPTWRFWLANLRWRLTRRGKVTP
jgi:hypothetical protein